MYYHASPIANIKILEPRISNHDVPLVYLSAKRENVLVYLSNAVEKYCKETGFSYTGNWSKWGPYGFDQSGKLVMEEYYPDALFETYQTHMRQSCRQKKRERLVLFGMRSSSVSGKNGFEGLSKVSMQVRWNIRNIGIFCGINLACFWKTGDNINAIESSDGIKFYFGEVTYHED